MPPFTGMTSSLITQNSSFLGDATAPVTHALSAHKRIPTLEESSPARRHIPSSPEKPSRQWLTSPFDKKKTRPSAPKCSTSTTPMIKLETWPKTWPISKNYTMTHAGKNKIPYGPSPMPTPFATLSHASSTMPRRPRTSLGPCSMPASTTLRTGGSMAPNNTTNDASGARDAGIPCAIAPESTNAYSVMGTGIKNSSAKFLTSDTGQGECVASLTTTPEWPTPTVHQTSGPSDDGKDINRGDNVTRNVAHMTQRGDSSSS
jgi:hypothetical protein